MMLKVIIGAVGGTNGLHAVAGGSGLPEPSSYISIGWILVSLVAIVTGVNQVMKLKAGLLGERKATEVSPQPLEVRVLTDYVKKEECVGRHGETQRQLNAIEAAIAEIRAERKTEAGTLHEKINGVAREVTGLVAVTELQNQRLSQMDAKLDRIVERR